MSRTPKGINRPIEKSTGAQRTFARLATAPTRTEPGTLKGLVKSRRDCFTCGGPLRHDYTGAVRRFCSASCKRARHNEAKRNGKRAYKAMRRAESAA